MKMEMITEGLRELLKDNNYNPATIKFYEREWSKIRSFLVEEHGETEYDMERGLKYLEKQYGFVTKYSEGSLPRQRVQLLRVVHMLEDYSLHKVLTRRYYASKNPLRLNEYYEGVYNRYCVHLDNAELSASTIGHYRSISTVFMDYLAQLGVNDAGDITMTRCNGYLKTQAGYSFKTVEQNVCGLRHFLRYLLSDGLLVDDLAKNIHLPPIPKGAKIPSAWPTEELKSMIAAIDRSNPIGKRDYAMIVLACVLGLRVGDIKALRFRNFDWDEKKISIIQSKTHKPLTLPLPDAVGWAVIDYIKNGRPNYHETDVVFLKHMPPFDIFSDNDHLGNRIKHYMQKAGINRYKERRSGFHSLRHSAGSMLLEMETPLPVITSILGHSDSGMTAVYLKTDLEKLAECILPPKDFANEQ